MKTLFALILISLALLCNSYKYYEICGRQSYPNGVGHCENSILPEGFYVCCFELYRIDSGEFQNCVPLTKEEFLNLSNFKKQRESQLPVHKKDDNILNCYTDDSKYIKLSIISLILLLL